MKRKEWIIIGILLLASAIAFAALRLRKSSSGATVAVQHRNEIVLRFDPAKDAVYHVDGDTGGLDIEVKDGKWHVINEQCPNHICANMGWMGYDNVILPITCLPNNIIIFVEESQS